MVLVGHGDLSSSYGEGAVVPRYLVRFSEPIWYLPDHPKARRLTTDLIVNAETPKQAETHALRVTRGAGEVVSCAVTEDRPQPVVETPPVGETVVVHA